MVVTETRRADSTWILDGQVTDRSTLSDELAQFCAKYSIYHVKETRDSLSVIRNQAEGETTKLLGDMLSPRAENRYPNGQLGTNVNTK